MKKKNFLFLPATLLCILFLTSNVFGAENPSLEIDSKNNSKKLILNHIPENCYGIEITLTTSTKDKKDYSTTIDGAYTTYSNDGLDVTLYIVSKDTPLNPEESFIKLGEISSDSSFTIQSAFDLKLLDEDLNKTEYDSVYIPGSSTSHSSSSSSSSSSSNRSSSYKIDVEDTENGSVKLSAFSAYKGQTIAITPAPQVGYALDSITVIDKENKKIDLTPKDKQYTFTMPSSNVTVKVEFKAISVIIPPSTPDTNENIILPFIDVKESDWYYSCVKYVYEQSMMAGTSTTMFSPDTTTTRGMIVTILHRLDGKPTAPVSNFTDIEQNQYYTEAVAWASANGIVSGYGNGNFGPNDTITREQMASILYRYAQYKNYNTSYTNNLSNYVDVEEISSYAITAIQWANGTGLISGITNTTLVPKGSATRAQVSSILMRFCENIVK